MSHKRSGGSVGEHPPNRPHQRRFSTIVRTRNDGEPVDYNSSIEDALEVLDVDFDGHKTTLSLTFLGQVGPFFLLFLTGLILHKLVYVSNLLQVFHRNCRTT